MASITQTIPSFTGGISQQPDELVLPGQVKDLVNGIPDITDGLVKRPGSRFINSLSGAAAGTWFSYYRDESEGAYIGQIQRNGTVKIWDSSGNAVSVSGSASSYLSHSNDEDIKFLTIADTTFVTNVDKVVSVDTSIRSDDRAESIGDSNNNIYQAFVELRQLAHGREYSFSVASQNDTEQNITATGEGRATSIEVVPQTGGGSGPPGNYDTINGRQGDRLNPNCEYQGSQVFTLDSGSGKNLVFRLTNTAQVVVDERNSSSEIHGDDYVAVYNTTVELLNGGYGWRAHTGSDSSDNHVLARFLGVDFKVKIKSVQEINVKKGFGFFRPEPSSFDANVEVSADSILSQMEKGSGTGQVNLNVVEKIGNGFFLAHSSPFTVETANPDLWRISPMEVNDASELPRQCKHGMIIKVISSADSVDDDFYLKFQGNNGVSGPGRWEECQGPGLLTTLDADTLPHIIQRQANGSFTVGTYGYVARQTGDNTTNPFPSLIKTPVSNNQGRKISQTFFHRNRLGFLCEDNVILSRAGEPGNFFQESSLVIGGSDPIDIQASSTQPTLLKSAIETNTGLVIFAETQQFLLHTDSDSLTPETGKVSNISTYRYSPQTDPISLGTTLGFIDSAGVNGRFFEVFDIRREGEPNMVEQTKVAPKLLPHDLDVMTNSRENNTIFFSKSGTAEIFGYRYFNTGDKRAQSAWFKWTLPHNIAHLFVLDDELYIISSDYKLLKIALQKLDTARDAVGDNFYENNLDGGYSVHLDSSLSLTAGSYDGTYTTVSHSFTGTGTKLGAVNLSTGEVFMEDETQRSGNTFKFNGDFAGDTVVVGWLFELFVNLPRIYVKQKAGEITTSDVTASLTIQRVHLRFGPVGQIHVRLKRLGKDHIETTYESTPMDYYDADEATFVPEKTQTVPVYERNKNCNLVLKSYHPGPAQFVSMTWEGDYTPMHHKRV
jgi:hypothetical protein